MEQAESEAMNVNGHETQSSSNSRFERYSIKKSFYAKEVSGLRLLKGSDRVSHSVIVPSYTLRCTTTRRPFCGWCGDFARGNESDTYVIITEDAIEILSGYTRIRAASRLASRLVYRLEVESTLLSQCFVSAVEPTVSCHLKIRERRVPLRSPRLQPYHRHIQSVALRANA